MDILHQIHDIVCKQPAQLAFIHREDRMTYRELWDKSDALASWLLQNVRDAEPVVVFGHKEPEMLVCFLACVKSHRPYVPIDIAIPAERLAHVLADAQSNCLLAPGTLPVHVPTDVPIVPMEQLRAIMTERTAVVSTDHWVGRDDPFYIIYTSGSTGDPKGVPITHNCLSSFLGWMRSNFDLSEQSIFLNQAPFSFDLSVMDLYTSLVTGGTVWAVDREMIAKPKQLFEGLKTAGINVWVSTPSFADFCLMEPTCNQTLLSDMRTFLFCGEALSRQCAERLMERFPLANIINTYGSTEATVAVTSIRIDQSVLERYSSLPVGYCKPDCRIEIRTVDGRCVDEGEKGEIWIIGPSVSPGYYQNQSLTKQKFTQWNGQMAYRTGDMGYIQAGLLFCSGRVDFQVKWQGYRIELEDIEDNLRRIPSVKAAVVIPKYKGDQCDYLTAFVVLDCAAAENDLRRTALIKRELGMLVPPYMLPRRIVLKDQLPMTANGKVDRKALQSEV